MSDEPDNLVPGYLRRLDSKLDRLIDDIGDLKHRTTSLEGQVARNRTEFGHFYEALAAVQDRLDRMDARLDRIERRFDVAEPTP